MGATNRATAGRILVYLLVAIAVLAAGVGNASADDGITINRTNESVKVTVQQSAAGGNDTQSVTVSAGSQEITNYTVDFANRSENTTHIQIREFRNVSGDLADKNITVEVTGINTTDRHGVDLRYVEESDNASVTARNVTLPVNSSSVIGIPEGGSVPVAVSAGNETVTVDARYRDGSLRLPMLTLRENVSLFQSLNFRVLPSVNGPSYDMNPQRAATAYVTPTADAAKASHPLVFAGQEYVVVATTSGPSGNFSRTVTANGPMTSGATDYGGRFALPEQLLYADQLTLQITEVDGRTIYDKSEAPAKVLKATETRQTTKWNTSTATVSLPRLPDALSAVWIQVGANETVQRYGDSIVNASAAVLDVPEAVAQTESDFTVVLIGSGGTYDTVTVDAVGSAASGQNGGSDGEVADDIGMQSTLSLVTNNPFLLAAIVIGLTSFGATWFGMRERSNVDEVTGGLAVGSVAFGIAFGWWATNGSLETYPVFLLTALSAAIVVVLLWATLASKTSIKSQMAVLASVGVIGVALTGGLVALWQTEYLSTIERPLMWGASYGFVAVTAVLWYGVSQNISGTDSSGPITYPTTVRVRDATGSAIEESVSVTLQEDMDAAVREVEVSDGIARVDLPSGQWRATAQYAGQRVTGGTKQAGNEFVIEFDGRPATVRCIDRETGDVIKGANVLAQVDGDERTGTTDENGVWRMTLPLSASRLAVEIDHDTYETEAWSTTALNNTLEKTIELRPLIGTISATVTMDGQGVPNIPVAVKQRDGNERGSGTTDSDGVVTFTDVPVGEYTIEPPLSDTPSQFSAGRTTVRVRDGETSRKQVAVQFDYDLSSTARERIRSLRSRADDIGTASRRDGAIQAYYASVLEASLDAVERIPESGYTLLTADIDPDEVVSALLDATEAATETVDDVMTSKRNVDLFSACSDLPSVTVSWRGQIGVDRVAALSEQDIGQQRGEVLDSLEAVDERISAAVSDVAEVSPAREMWEAVRTMVRDNTGATQVESAALITVAEALLDAIDGLFDDDRLRARMERTVY